MLELVADAKLMSEYLIVAGLSLLAWIVVGSFKTALRRKTSRPRAAVILFSYFPEDPRPRREAEALVRDGFEVDFFCLRQDRNEQLYESVCGISVYRFPLKRRRMGKLTYAFQYGSFLLASFTFLTLRMFRFYQIVHVHNMPDVLVFSAMVSKWLGAKVILDLHDPMPEVFQVIYNLKEDSHAVRALKLIERASISFADAVLTPNIAFRDLFISRGCPVEKIGIVMNSPDEVLFKPKPAEDQKKEAGYHVMFHGTLVERNGLGLAVEAVARIEHKIPGLKLHIYGERNSYVSEMMRKVDELRVVDRLEYHGYKPQKQVPAAISMVDLGIVPNLANPFNSINLPTRIFEYLSMGKLPIVPRTKGIRDYFEEDELLFFEPGNAADLASKIEWAFANPVEARDVLCRGCQVYEMHRWQFEERGFLKLAHQLAGIPEQREALPPGTGVVNGVIQRQGRRVLTASDGTVFE